MNHLTVSNKVTDLWDDPVQAKVFVAAILALLYILASTLMIFVQLVSSKNHNAFIVIKFVYYKIVLSLLITSEVLVCIGCFTGKKGEEQEQNREEQDQTGEEQEQNRKKQEQNGEEQDQNGEKQEQNEEEQEYERSGEEQQLKLNIQVLEEQEQNKKICKCLTEWVCNKFKAAYGNACDYCKKQNILLLISVKVLSLALILLSLSVFPTLLLLFAHPENTFALIVIHIALVYTETVIGAYLIERLNRCTCPYPCCHTSKIRACCNFFGLWNKCKSCLCCRRQYEDLSAPSPNGNQQNQTHGTEKACPWYCQPNKCVLFWGILALVTLLISVYLLLIGLYQFLILRNDSSNVAFDMIIQYIPGVAIVALGFFVSKSTDQETMNGKNAKKWLKLGEILNTDMSKDEKNDLDENKRNQIKCLQKVFKHDEILNKLTQLQQTMEVGLNK